MDVKKLRNIIKDGVAEMVIYDQIGQTIDETTNRVVGISGVDFARDIMALDAMEDVKEIRVRINSPGGSVLEGSSIFSAILRTKTRTNTYCDGIAASIAGIIFQAGKKRHMVDFGRLMIHAPSMGVPDQLLNEKQRTLIDSSRHSLLTILNGNSKISNDEMTEIMAAETWLNATESIEKGLADKVVTTGREFNQADTVDQILELSNSYIKTIKNQNQMKDLQNHFGLDDKATEKQILESVKGVENQLSTSKTEIEAKDTEIAILKNSVEEMTGKVENVESVTTENTELKNKLATLTVENAIAKGLFDSKKKAELIEQCKNDSKGFDILIGALKPQAVKVTNLIDQKPGEKKQSLRDMEKNNPTEVARLRNEEPEQFAALYKEQYGVEPNA